MLCIARISKSVDSSVLWQLSGLGFHSTLLLRHVTFSNMPFTGHAAAENRVAHDIMCYAMRLQALTNSCMGA